MFVDLLDVDLVSLELLWSICIHSISFSTQLLDHLPARAWAITTTNSERTRHRSEIMRILPWYFVCATIQTQWSAAGDMKWSLKKYNSIGETWCKQGQCGEAVDYNVAVNDNPRAFLLCLTARFAASSTPSHSLTLNTRRGSPLIGGCSPLPKVYLNTPRILPLRCNPSLCPPCLFAALG